MKYLVNENQIEEILHDEYILSIKDDKEEEIIPMHAEYYDTEDLSLLKDKIAIRIRKEGCRYVATLKWNGYVENGFHRRQEINVPIIDEELIHQPTIEIFEQSEIYPELKNVTKGRPMKKFLDMEFIRRQIRLDTGESISMFSVDTGKIRGGGKEIPISEIEIELFSGDEEDILELGAKIARKYDLKTEDQSKLQRGYQLIR